MVGNLLGGTVTNSSFRSMPSGYFIKNFTIAVLSFRRDLSIHYCLSTVVVIGNSDNLIPHLQLSRFLVDGFDGLNVQPFNSVSFIRNDNVPVANIISKNFVNFTCLN